MRTRLELAAVGVSPGEQVAGGPAPSHVLSVHGSDHPGIVASVSSLLAERGISIMGLETRLGGGAEQPVYVMLMEIALGEDDTADLQASLESLGREEGLEVSLRALDAGLSRRRLGGRPRGPPLPDPALKQVAHPCSRTRSSASGRPW